MKMELKTVLYSVENSIATIIMNQPKALNPMNDESMDDMLTALQAAAEDPAVKVVVLRGAGRAFCGGGDINFFVDAVKEPNFGLQPLVSKVGKVLMAMRALPKPIVCAVQNAAAGGGCNLVLACDYVVAADNAKFIEAFVNIGLAPDTGGVFWLPRLVGAQRAFEMMATGRPVLAEEALRLGMVNEVVELDKLEERAYAMAAKFAAGPSVALANLKKMMNRSIFPELEDYLRLEALSMDECSRTEDFVEGITAFKEKRKAQYQGK